ncbi:NUDIX domain-containing protein [Nanoarchaeota archaeon]
MTENYEEEARIAVDTVIFTIHENKLKILLHKREKEPFKGLLELPGGLMTKLERAEDVIKRKLDELIGKQNIYVEPFFAFTDPNRDPRKRTISLGFIALINQDHMNNPKDWHDIKDLNKLAFDHKEILDKAISYLKLNINSLIAKQFLPKEFPLNRLQDVYEILENKEYDNRNFRKKMISSGIVKETKKYEKDVSHRPAKLFKFK